jgi:hypothetical protein
MMAAGRPTATIIAVTAAACPLVFAGAGLAAAGSRMPAGARAAALAGTWHTAQKVPGAATLNKGGNAQVQSVSCTSAGNCSAGGYYTDSSGYTQAFVVSQVNGTWRTARKVPGTATLNQTGNAEVNSVSCASAGNCSAGGYYKDGSWHYQAFVVSQVNGTWRTARKVPGTAALNQGGNAWIGSVSCASAGNCSAGGQYVDSSGGGQAFVVSQVNGIWRTAMQVPGTAALNTGGGTWISSVSCASAGNCSAGGSYGDGSGHTQVFVVSQVNGTWRTAIEVPGTAAFNTGGAGDIYSVSCASAGNCSAGGAYWNGSWHAFVLSQVHGIWRTAIEVPGTAALSQGGAWIGSVSCASAGNCGAGGWYQAGSGHSQAFVVSQVNGTWRTAIQVPGTATLNQGGAAWLVSVSCASAGKCSAGGGYTDSSGHRQAFVVTES